MPQNASMKTVKEIANGQRFRFFFANGLRNPCTVNALNLGDSADFKVQFYRAPNGRNAVKTLTFQVASGTTGRLTGGTFKLTVNGVTTGEITYSATPGTLETNIATALNALATDNPRAMTGGFNVVASVKAGAYGAAASSWTQTVRIEFLGAFGKQPVTLSATNVALTTTNLSDTVSFAYTDSQVGKAPGAADANSLYEAVYPDGYVSTTYDAANVPNGAPLTIPPRASMVYSFGQGGATGHAGLNSGLLGPYVDIVCTGGRGQLEFGFGADAINEIAL